MEIQYVEKSEIYPMFGCYRDGIIKIRQDLPLCVREFLLDHELAHQDDIADGEGLVAKETESNWAGICRHPIGFLLTMVMSIFLPYRWAYYVERLRTGK